jgi:hypothetical protein
MAFKHPAKTAPAKTAKTPNEVITIEAARLLCPHAGNAQSVSAAFGLEIPEFDAIKNAHHRLLTQAWLSFEDALNEKATLMHFQRVTGSLVSSACGAGRFYSTKVTDARDLTARTAHDDLEQEAPVGFDSRAARAQGFAAEMAMQAYALLAAAEGAIEAFKEITGKDWKPYEAPAENQPLARRASAASLAAFG